MTAQVIPFPHGRTPVPSRSSTFVPEDEVEAAAARVIAESGRPVTREAVRALVMRSAELLGIEA